MATPTPAEIVIAKEAVEQVCEVIFETTGQVHEPESVLIGIAIGASAQQTKDKLKTGVIGALSALAGLVIGAVIAARF